MHTSPLDVSTVSKSAIEVKRGRYRGNVFVSLQKTLFNTDASNKNLCLLLLTVVEGTTIIPVPISFHAP